MSDFESLNIESLVSDILASEEVKTDTSQSVFASHISSNINKNADLANKRAIINETKTDQEYEKIIQLRKEIGELKNISFEVMSKEELEHGIDMDMQSAKNSLFFVSEQMTQDIKITRGNIVLIGAISGQGKTTTAAAMAYSVLQNQDKSILYLSNEEKPRNFLCRLACIHNGHSYKDFRNGVIPPEEQQKIRRSAVDDFRPRVKVMNGPETRCAAGIRSILDNPKSQEYAVIILDYWQGINKENSTSISASSDDSKTKVLDNLKGYITQYGNNPDSAPLVIFTQLMYLPSTDKERNFENRVKWGKSIFEASDWVVEAINRSELFATIFASEKVRWGTKKLFPHKFSKDRFFSITVEEFKELQRNSKEAKKAIDDMFTDDILMD